jgi:hypothetical protein
VTHQHAKDSEIIRLPGSVFVLKQAHVGAEFWPQKGAHQVAQKEL